MRCQRMVSDAWGDLCRKCHAQEQLESQCITRRAEAVQPLSGYVRSTGGALGDVKVALQGVDGHTLTDAAGAFSLGELAAARLVLVAGELFDLLRTSYYPGGCEGWLRDVVARHHEGGFFARVLRHSEIGAAIDSATFVSLLTQQEVWACVAYSVYKTLGKRPDLVLSFSKEGFAPCSVPLPETGASTVEVEMQAVAATGRVDPTAGGEVVDPESGASVTLAPGTSLVHADGSPYAGEVFVSLAVIDATDAKSLATMPGDFSAVDVRGQPAQLESFGAVWVGLEGSRGGKLQLLEGSPGLTMELPSQVPVNFARLNVPPTLWEFNDTTGKWQQDANVDLAVDGINLPRAGVDPAKVRPSGRGNIEQVVKPRKIGKAKGKAKMGAKDEFHRMNFDDFLEGAETWTPEAFQKVFQPPKRRFQLKNIPRAGYWNCDAVYITTFLTGVVVDANGVPVRVANVWSVGRDYAGASPRSGLGEGGHFSIVAQCRCKIDVYVLLPGAGDVAAKPVRLCFGPFETNEPGESKSLGVLDLSRGVSSPVGSDSTSARTPN